MSEDTLETTEITPGKCSRTYQMGQRAAAMDETRARLLTAARELILSENALTGFSMENVARQAGVTRVTVYNRVASRRGLLEALLNEVGARGRLHDRLPEVLALPDAREALRAYIEVFCEFWDDDRALQRRLRGFAQLDAEFAAAIASRYERHQHAIEKLLRRLDENKAAPRTRKERIQTVMALTGFEFYDALAGARKPHQVAPLIFHLCLVALNPNAKS